MLGASIVSSPLDLSNLERHISIGSIIRKTAHEVPSFRIFPQKYAVSWIRLLHESIRSLDVGKEDDEKKMPMTRMLLTNRSNR